MPRPYQRKRPPRTTPRQYQRKRPQLPTPPAAGLDGYRSLVVAVFRQACVDARGGPDLREEARDWLASDEPAWLLELAGLEPDAVLPRVRQSLGPG